MVDDMQMVQALCHFAVCPMATNFPLGDALFDIFSCAGKVHALMLTIATLRILI
jgi:hypothetical protein